MQTHTAQLGPEQVAALAEGKPIPTELREEAGALRREITLEDHRTGAAPTTHVDDEYAHAGEREPKVRANSWQLVSRHS